MAEQTPGIHVDSDWKKQAQEEKRRLAEEEAKRKAQAPPAATAPTGAPAARTQGPGRGQREMPPASFGTLVQSVATQVLFYLGELATREGEAMVDLDMARHQIDTLAVLEEKTRGNLTPEERALLDAALYEVRMRFVAVASQVASYP